MTKWLMDLVFAFIDGAVLILVLMATDAVFGWSPSTSYFNIFWYLVWASWFAKGSWIYPKNA